MFQNEVKHVVLMPSSTNLEINKEVTHNTRQNNKIVGTQYREIPTTKVENFDPSLCKLVTLGVQILRRLHYFFHVKINVHSCNGKRKEVDKFIKTFKGTSVEETKELSPCKCNKFGKHYISVKSMFFIG